jgi:drug/metabolite transporter (DMT)-like permease
MRASMISMLEPVVALACRAAVFREQLRPLQRLGIAAVLSGLVAMELSGKGRSAAGESALSRRTEAARDLS